MKHGHDRMLQELFGMSIGSYAGEPMVGVRDERNLLGNSCDVCPGCGTMPIDGVCDCQASQGCCAGCGLESAECECEESDVCPSCGMMSSSPDMPCSCGMSDGRLMEKAPPGHEKMVRGLKKAQKKGEVENAYAIAWHHYNAKHKGVPGGGKKHRASKKRKG